VIAICKPGPWTTNVIALLSLDESMTGVTARTLAWKLLKFTDAPSVNLRACNSQITEIETPNFQFETLFTFESQI